MDEMEQNDEDVRRYIEEGSESEASPSEVESAGSAHADDIPASEEDDDFFEHQASLTAAAASSSGPDAGAATSKRRKWKSLLASPLPAATPQLATPPAQPAVASATSEDADMPTSVAPAVEQPPDPPVRAKETCSWVGPKGGKCRAWAVEGGRCAKHKLSAASAAGPAPASSSAQADQASSGVQAASAGAQAASAGAQAAEPSVEGQAAQEQTFCAYIGARGGVCTRLAKEGSCFCPPHAQAQQAKQAGAKNPDGTPPPE